ncbi:hypothetical protein DM860_006300 [Cuscuta australis]|uniref:Uncharacterized protein n=1 Tax=Cuscuta australis TaxID=267555 RepID=A0A328DKY0_9ASTE|nr:hypothetical protein DM860_006300 [Cuscuta australis]
MNEEERTQSHGHGPINFSVPPYSNSNREDVLSWPKNRGVRDVEIFSEYEALVRALNQRSSTCALDLNVMAHTFARCALAQPDVLDSVPLNNFCNPLLLSLKFDIR